MWDCSIESNAANRLRSSTCGANSTVRGRVCPGEKPRVCAALNNRFSNQTRTCFRRKLDAAVATVHQSDLGHQAIEDRDLLQLTVYRVPVVWVARHRLPGVSVSPGLVFSTTSSRLARLIMRPSVAPTIDPAGNHPQPAWPQRTRLDGSHGNSCSPQKCAPARDRVFVTEKLAALDELVAVVNQVDQFGAEQLVIGMLDDWPWTHQHLDTVCKELISIE